MISMGNIKHVNSSRFGQTYEATLDDKTVVPVSRSKYGKLKSELEVLGIPFVKGIILK